MVIEDDTINFESYGVEVVLEEGVIASILVHKKEYWKHSSIPQHYSLWGTFIYWSDIFGIYPLIWGFSGVLGSCVIIKSPNQWGKYDNHKEILP